MMAVMRSGPLAGEIAGSVGGVCFQRAAGGGNVRTRAHVTTRGGAALQESQGLMLTAAKGWNGLSEGDRAAWESAAASLGGRGRFAGGRRRSGRGLYIGSIMRQRGVEPIVTPGPPAVVQGQVPLEALMSEYSDSVMLAGFDRDLATGETAVVRSMQVQPVTRNAPVNRVERAVTVQPGEGLGEDAENAQAGNGTDARGVMSGLGLGVSSRTVEMWVRFTQVRSSQGALWRMGDAPVMGEQVGGDLWVTIGGVRTIAVAWVPEVGRWYYVAQTYEGGGSNWTSYVDGNAMGAAASAPVAAWNGALVVAEGSAAQLWTAGDFDEIRISDVARSPAEIAANWNNGRGRLMPVDANTLALWHMNSIDGTTVGDASGNSRPLVMSGGWAGAAGAFNRELYAAAERPYVAPGRVWLFVDSGFAGVWPGPGRWDFYDWL